MKERFDYSEKVVGDMVSMEHPNGNGPLIFKVGDKCWVEDEEATESIRSGPGIGPLNMMDNLSKGVVLEVGRVTTIYRDGDVLVSFGPNNSKTYKEKEFKDVQRAGWKSNGDPKNI